MQIVGSPQKMNVSRLGASSGLPNQSPVESADAAEMTANFVGSDPLFPMMQILGVPALCAQWLSHLTLALVVDCRVYLLEYRSALGLIWASWVCYPFNLLAFPQPYALDDP